MKAKEYVAIFNDMLKRKPKLSELYENVPADEDREADELDYQWDLCRRLTSEVKVLSEARKARSPEAMVGIMCELQDKWEAVCRQLNRPTVIPAAWGLYLEATGITTTNAASQGVTDILLNRRTLLSDVASAQRIHGAKYRR